MCARTARAVQRFPLCASVSGGDHFVWLGLQSGGGGDAAGVVRLYVVGMCGSMGGGGG